MLGLNIYNIFICLMMTLVGGLNLWQIQKRYKGNREAELYGWVWFFAGLLWFMVGLGAIFRAIGRVDSEYSIYYLVHLFIVLNIGYIFYYIFYRLFKQKLVGKILTVVFSLGCLMYYVFIIVYGITGPYWTSFAAEYVPNPVSANIFKVVFGVGILFIIYAFIYEPYRWIRQKKASDLYKFFTMLALIIYAGVGYFEELGLYENWQMFLARLILFSSFLIAYLSYNYKPIEKTSIV